MKKLVIVIVCIIFAVSGFIIGYFCNSNNQNSTDEEANITKTSQNETNNNKDVLVENFEEENNYPFQIYQSFLINGSTKTVDAINNNPIDKKYYEQLSNTKSLAEEQEVLSSWIIAYEKEFENAKNVLENSIKAKSTDSDITKEEMLKIVDEYIDCCSTYSKSTSQLAYKFEEFNLGHGTNHAYNLLVNSLAINRINTLHLIECIYMLDGDYIWNE